MVMVISTYHFSFHDHPRVHTARVRCFLTFLARFGLVLFFISALGLSPFPCLSGNAALYRSDFATITQHGTLVR